MVQPKGARRTRVVNRVGLRQTEARQTVWLRRCPHQTKEESDMENSHQTNARLRISPLGNSLSLLLVISYLLWVGFGDG